MQRLAQVALVLDALQVVLVDFLTQGVVLVAQGDDVVCGKQQALRTVLVVDGLQELLREQKGLFAADPFLEDSLQFVEVDVLVEIVVEEDSESVDDGLLEVIPLEVLIHVAETLEGSEFFYSLDFFLKLFLLGDQSSQIEDDLKPISEFFI